MRVIPGNIIACLYDQLGPVRVYDDGNKRYLSFGQGDEQSCMVKSQPLVLQHDYNRAMALVLLFYRLPVLKLELPRNILILGMGGGSLLRSLHQQFDDAFIEVVELRQTVIDVAKKYFDIPVADNINVVNQDALTYLDTMPGQCFNLLFSDLYIPEGLEARQLTRQFLTNAKQVLTDDGFLVINALEEYRTEQVLKSLFVESFELVYECVTKDGNWVIIATNHKEMIVNKPKLKSLKAQVKNLSDQLGFSLLPQFKLLK